MLEGVENGTIPLVTDAALRGLGEKIGPYTQHNICTTHTFDRLLKRFSQTNILEFVEDEDIATIKDGGKEKKTHKKFLQFKKFTHNAQSKLSAEKLKKDAYWYTLIIG